jgi:hypothetical protein
VGFSKHGLAEKVPEYFIWEAMRQRCMNSKHPSYHCYGGRGITVCERWDDFSLFLEDVGRRPSPDFTLERKANNGNYEPGNVKWALRVEQQNNTRSNVVIHFQGDSLTISQWARKLGIKANTIVCRLRRNLPVEMALSPTPLGRNQWS